MKAQKSSEQVCRTQSGFPAFWSPDLNANGFTESRAQWIWLPDSSSSCMALVRKLFKIKNLPESCMLTITASSRYELYINEQYVSSGPARCASHHQSYDRFDIASALKVGTNLIAVRVHHQKGTSSYYLQSKGGLLLELNLQELSVQTDSSWSICEDPSWSRCSPYSSRFNDDLLDRIDFNKDLRWEFLDCDAKDWCPAKVLARELGWPCPQNNDSPTHKIPPWTQFVARDIPYIQENYIAASAPVWNPLINEIDFELDLWETIDPIVSIPIMDSPKRSGGIFKALNTNKSGQAYVFDFGHFYNAKPQIKVLAPRDTIVEVIASPYLLNGELRSNNVDAFLVDRIRCSGNEDSWKSFYIKPIRWLAIVFRRLEGVAKLQEVGIQSHTYPFTEESSLSIPDDSKLELFWTAAQKTIKSCTIDAYTDNYRERRQYAQTAYYACLGNYPTFGDTYLQRRYLTQIAQEQLADGTMPAYAPRHGDDFMVILDSNCFWLKGLKQYLFYSGDSETVSSLVPSALKLIELFLTFCSPDGIIENPPYPYWLDHARNDRRGSNFCLNAHFLMGVESLMEVLKHLNFPSSDIDKMRLISKKFRNELGSKFFNKEKGFYVDCVYLGQQSKEYSEHANAMALTLEIGDFKRLDSISNSLSKYEKEEFVQRKDSELFMVTPAMSYYLHKGLCQQEKIWESLELFKKRFSHMLDLGENGTLWEEWWLNATGRSGNFQLLNHGRSDAQTESAFPPALIQEFVLGIEVLKPGMMKLRIRYPIIKGLNTRRAALPTPHGPLEIEWSKIGKCLSLSIKSPKRIKIVLDYKSLEVFGKYKVHWNGEKIQYPHNQC